MSSRPRVRRRRREDKAIGDLVASGDRAALPLLQAMLEGEVQTVGDGPRADRQRRQRHRRGHRGRRRAAARRSRRCRRSTIACAGTSRLRSPRSNSPHRSAPCASRLRRNCRTAPTRTRCRPLAAALAKEGDPEVKGLLDPDAGVDPAREHRSGDAPGRGHARWRTATRAPPRRCCWASSRRRTASSSRPTTKSALRPQRSLSAVEGRLAKGDIAARIFSGISLGTILLLAALGLAITYGLMGVINMAHGELIMIGAYATYVVQNLFRQHVRRARSTGTCCSRFPSRFS